VLVVLVRLDAGAHEEHEMEEQQDGAEGDQGLLEPDEAGEGVCVVALVAAVVEIVAHVLERPDVPSHTGGEEADDDGGNEPYNEMQRYIRARVNAAVGLGDADGDELGCLPDDG
jgi:hypothetical protein